MGNSSSNVSKIIPGGLIGENGNPSGDLNEIIKKIFYSSKKIFDTKYVDKRRGVSTPQKSSRVIPIEQTGHTHTTTLLYMCIYMLKIKIALLEYPRLQIEPENLIELNNIDEKLNESQINMTRIMPFEELYRTRKSLTQGFKDEIVRTVKMLILEFYQEVGPISKNSINNIQEIRQRIIDLRLSQIYAQQQKEEAEAKLEQAIIESERQRIEAERQIKEQLPGLSANVQYQQSIDEAIRRINQAAAEAIRQAEEAIRQAEEAAAAEARLVEEARLELEAEQEAQRLKYEAEEKEKAENIEQVRQFEENSSGEKRKNTGIQKEEEVILTNPNNSDIIMFKSYIESNENPNTPCQKIILDAAKMKVSENDNTITKCPICLMNIFESFILEPIESNKNQNIISYPSNASNTTFIMIHADCFRELIKSSTNRNIKAICPTTRQQYGKDINIFYLLMLSNDNPSASICDESDYRKLKTELGIMYGGSKKRRKTSKKNKSSKQKKGNKRKSIKRKRNS